MFSYGNDVYIYHSLEIEPTLVDYEEWLEGLSNPIREDIGMEEFVKEKMGSSEFEKYQSFLK